MTDGGSTLAIFVANAHAGCYHRSCKWSRPWLVGAGRLAIGNDRWSGLVSRREYGIRGVVDAPPPCSSSSELLHRLFPIFPVLRPSGNQVIALIHRRGSLEPAVKRAMMVLDRQSHQGCVYYEARSSRQYHGQPGMTALGHLSPDTTGKSSMSVAHIAALVTCWQTR